MFNKFFTSFKNGFFVFNGDVNEGISLYLGTNTSESSTKILFNDDKRADFLRDNHLISLLSFELLNKKNYVFYLDEIIKFRLKWIVNTPINNLSLRVKLVGLNGEYVANYFLDSFMNCEKKGYDKIFEIDLRSLMYGKYSLTFVFSYSMIEGRSELIEAITNCVTIEIKKREQDMYWSSQYWGSVKLDGIKLVSDNE